MAQCLLYLSGRTLDQVTSEANRQEIQRGIQMYKLILLAMAAMTFLATVPPSGKAGW